MSECGARRCMLSPSHHHKQASPWSWTLPWLGCSSTLAISSVQLTQSEARTGLHTPSTVVLLWRHRSVLPLRNLHWNLQDLLLLATYCTYYNWDSCQAAMLCGTNNSLQRSPAALLAPIIICMLCQHKTLMCKLWILLK